MKKYEFKKNQGFPIHINQKCIKYVKQMNFYAIYVAFSPKPFQFSARILSSHSVFMQNLEKKCMITQPELGTEDFLMEDFLKISLEEKEIVQ